ncbi:MAG: DUF1573 domain-containing protein [Puniceicoccales bacterium]|jgi:hypothetical protein|nr:DUF1573 domain-containing protein [Puniceicoccales bacterium]
MTQPKKSFFQKAFSRFWRPPVPFLLIAVSLVVSIGEILHPFIHGDAPEGRRSPAPATPVFEDSTPLVKPEIQFPAHLEFGRIPVRDGVAEKTMEFPLLNNSGEPLEIAGIAASCPCVTIDFHEKHIAAGEAVPVRIKVRLGADETLGRKVHILAKAKTKSGRVFQLQSTLFAAADFSLLLRPEALDFGMAASGSTLRKTVEARIGGTKPISQLIRAVSFENPDFFSAEIGPPRVRENRIAETGETHFETTSEITLLFRPGGKEGPASGGMSIDLFDGTRKTLPIHWVICRKPIFEPSEKRHYLQIEGKGKTHAFSILYNEDFFGKLREAQTSGEGLHVSGKEREGKGVRLKLDYRFDAPPPPNAKIGELRVVTECGKTHTLEIVAS